MASVRKQDFHRLKIERKVEKLSGEIGDKNVMLVVEWENFFEGLSTILFLKCGIQRTLTSTTSTNNKSCIS